MGLFFELPLAPISTYEGKKGKKSSFYWACVCVRIKLTFVNFFLFFTWNLSLVRFSHTKALLLKRRWCETAKIPGPAETDPYVGYMWDFHFLWCGMHVGSKRKWKHSDTGFPFVNVGCMWDLQKKWVCVFTFRYWSSDMSN